MIATNNRIKVDARVGIMKMRPPMVGVPAFF